MYIFLTVFSNCMNFVDQPSALSEKDESEASPIIDVYGMHLVSLPLWSTFRSISVICYWKEG